MNCLSCGAPVTAVNPQTDKHYTRCSDCRETMRKRARTIYCADPQRKRDINNAHTQRRRQAVLELYGSCCVCCGETEEAFLALDHIHNDGSQHRANRGYHGVYRDALEHDPERFQILCYNCNHAKATQGICPHQRVLS